MFVVKQVLLLLANKEHLTCCTFAQEVGSGKLSYLTLQTDCVGSVGDVSESKRKNKIWYRFPQERQRTIISCSTVEWMPPQPPPPPPPPPPKHTHKLFSGAEIAKWELQGNTWINFIGFLDFCQKLTYPWWGVHHSWSWLAWYTLRSSNIHVSHVNTSYGGSPLVQSLNIFALVSGNPQQNTSAFGENGKSGWNEQEQCIVWIPLQCRVPDAKRANS